MERIARNEPKKDARYQKPKPSNINVGTSNHHLLVTGQSVQQTLSLSRQHFTNIKRSLSAGEKTIFKEGCCILKPSLIQVTSFLQTNTVSHKFQPIETHQRKKITKLQQKKKHISRHRTKKPLGKKKNINNIKWQTWYKGSKL